MKTARQAELRLAYSWDCDECGAENFERSIVYELSPEEKAELEEMDEVAETGNWISHPERVTCKKCGAEFEAHHFKEADDTCA